MNYKMKSKDWVRDLMDRFSSIVPSTPTARIVLKNVHTGECRSVWINVGCLADEYFCSGFEELCADEEFVFA